MNRESVADQHIHPTMQAFLKLDEETQRFWKNLGWLATSENIRVPVHGATYADWIAARAFGHTQVHDAFLSMLAPHFITETTTREALERSWAEHPDKRPEQLREAQP